MSSGRGLASLLAAVLSVGVAWGAPVLGYRVVATLPHAAANFTEGFFFLDGLFYEGTGLEGRSGVVVTRPDTGRVVKAVSLPAGYFGEGIVNWGPYLYEWTWTSHVCFVYERRTLRQVRTLAYTGEGWGMTRDGSHIITSDGSAELTFRDPETFRPVRSITVHDGPVVISQVNELEYVRGEIYANMWHSDRIVRVSPADGHVLAYVDLSGLRPEETRLRPEAVLNGIAYDAVRDRLFVTGKQWPAIFEIRVVEPARGEPKGHGKR